MPGRFSFDNIRIARRPIDVELVEGSLTDEADEYFEINVRGTFLVLEAARRQSNLQQLLFASTDALYDKYVPGGMSEPIDPDRSPRRRHGSYALSKSISEELCNGYDFEPQYDIFRMIDDALAFEWGEAIGVLPT